MRWNCPHCSTALYVADDKLGPDWSFARCYQCKGHSLVRRSDVQMMQSDTPPPQEVVITPEKVDNNLPKSPFVARSEVRGIKVNTSQTFEQSTDSNSDVEEDPTFISKILPYAMFVTAVLAVGSGTYLFRHGQDLWKKARKVAISVQKGMDQNMDQAVEAKAIETQSSENQAQAIDQISQKAMAPDRHAADAATVLTPELKPGDSLNQMSVLVRSKNTALRAGPGTQFKILAHATPDISYKVLDWKDQWFKVESPGLQGQTKLEAWVRNDLVQLQTTQAH